MNFGHIIMVLAQKNISVVDSSEVVTFFESALLCPKKRCGEGTSQGQDGLRMTRWPEARIELLFAHNYEAPQDGPGIE